VADAEHEANAKWRKAVAAAEICVADIVIVVPEAKIVEAHSTM
jgi:hypothetical protein